MEQNGRVMFKMDADVRNSDVRGSYVRDSDVRDSDVRGSYVRDSDVRDLYIYYSDGFISPNNHQHRDSTVLLLL